jgi:fatty-acid desaturase
MITKQWVAIHRKHHMATETEHDPHLVVAGPEVHHIARLEVARLRTALLLRVAGLWVLLCVLPAMVQHQQHTHEKKDF